QAAGLSGFASLIFNKDSNNQLRLIASGRGDHYQVPIDPTASPILHDVENERDDFVNFSWLHTIGTGVTLTVSPFYHFNRAHYEPNTDDTSSPNMIADQITPAELRPSGWFEGSTISTPASRALVSGTI